MPNKKLWDGVDGIGIYAQLAKHAIKDANGNVIDSTYATKSELSTKQDSLPQSSANQYLITDANNDLAWASLPVTIEEMDELPIIIDPYNPLGLPDYTFRFKFGNSDYTPESEYWDADVLERLTFTQISASPNVWDITYNPATAGDCSGLFQYMFGSSGTTEILGMNTSSIVNMSEMFNECNKLVAVPAFDASAATNMNSMFSVTHLRKIKPFKFTAPSVDNLYSYCFFVVTGALEMYNLLSANPAITSHTNTFTECGSEMATGQTELAQIPSSWGGTAE